MTLDYLCVCCGYLLRDLPSSAELVAVMKEHRTTCEMMSR